MSPRAGLDRDDGQTNGIRDFPKSIEISINENRRRPIRNHHRSDRCAIAFVYTSFAWFKRLTRRCRGSGREMFGILYRRWAVRNCSRTRFGTTLLNRFTAENRLAVKPQILNDHRSTETSPPRSTFTCVLLQFLISREDGAKAKRKMKKIKDKSRDNGGRDKTIIFVEKINETHAIFSRPK